MSDTTDHQPGEPRPDRELMPWERWAHDEQWRPIIEFDGEAHARWCRKWAPPCPDGNPRRLCQLLGFRERHRCQLELRVVMGGRDLYVCNAIVDERDDEVYVRVLACYDEDDEQGRSLEYIDCPVRVWLDRPLGSRKVVDVDSDEELPLHTPHRLNNIVQLDNGHRPTNRRRPRT